MNIFRYINIKKYLFYLLLMLWLILPNTVYAASVTLNNSELNALNSLLSIIYMVMSTICGLGLIISVMAFAKCAIKLAKSGDGKERSEAYQDILHCTIYTACLSSAPALYTILLALFI